MTGSEVLWGIAGTFGVVPRPVSGIPRRLIEEWWAAPRTLACPSAARQEWWHVVMPDPSVLCLSHTMTRFRAENRCAVCRGPLDPDAAVGVYEAAGVRFLGLFHPTCEGD